MKTYTTYQQQGPKGGKPICGTGMSLSDLISI